MSNAYLDALKKRRTQYSLGRNLSASKEELASLIQEAIKHSPSSVSYTHLDVYKRQHWC